MGGHMKQQSDHTARVSTQLQSRRWNGKIVRLASPTRKYTGFAYIAAKKKKKLEEDK